MMESKTTVPPIDIQVSFIVQHYAISKKGKHLPLQILEINIYNELKFCDS